MTQRHDMTPRVDLTRHLGTGAVRARRPRYVDLLPPCNEACPAGENVQAWLADAQAGRFRAAWETLVRDNPLPAVHGRVCYHPCESRCNRGELDDAVGIHAVERFLGDLAAREGWPLPKPAPPTGKRVLVVGAGPSGLSAAYHLTRLGHAVEIHEAGPLPGGMLHFGIPAYRLPRADLLREIGRIEAMGVTIVVNHPVEDVLAEMRAGRFDAVFLAIGAHRSKHVDIPARDAVQIVDAVTLLRDVAAGAPPSLGRRVVVYGGGNTAMDAARTVRRLGADDAMIVYRRDRAHMPAHAFEADEALAEGVRIRWLSSIAAIDGGAVTVEVMELGPDGRARPTGRYETLTADAVVLAVGQDAESGFLRSIPEIVRNEDGTVAVGPDMMTGRPGIFAGGDMVPERRSVTIATGHGKKAARHIDAWLRGTRFSAPAKHPGITLAGLNLPIYADALPAAEPTLPPAARGGGFAEVVAGLDEQAAVHEAKRCLSCGNCFECDQCWAACPEDAIVKHGPGRRYSIDPARCTGCAVCVEQCPCHAMEMVPEGTRGTTPERTRGTTPEPAGDPS
jgi:NADPH-dependent glutamate synthase beta subunit-like oxidoreductase